MKYMETFYGHHTAINTSLLKSCLKHSGYNFQQTAYWSIFSFLFFHETGFDISCKLSPSEILFLHTLYIATLFWRGTLFFFFFHSFIYFSFFLSQGVLELTVCRTKRWTRTSNQSRIIAALLGDKEIWRILVVSTDIFVSHILDL